MPRVEMRVQRVEVLTPRIRRFVLERADGQPLPAYTAGAHLEFEVWPPGAPRALHRAYSLVSPWNGGGACEIAVQLEPEGTGGSQWMHRLEPGAVLHSAAPRNLFELGRHEQPPLLLAAGIGVTPILCMARTLHQEGAAFELHYAAREREQAAYVDDIEALPGARCWFDGGDPSRGMNLREVIGRRQGDRHLYVCGPKGFIQAALQTAREQGWPEDALHCELFSGALPAAAERGFTVVLRPQGRELQVPAGASVMDAMEQAGLDPMFDCRRGECGICVAKVLEGEADHRDICLSEQDHAAGLFCTCVSRARSERLVLQL